MRCSHGRDIAIKTISVKAQNVSRTVQRKLSRMSTLDDGEYNIPAYLIAQLGKNFQSGLNDSITGGELLSLAMEQISIVRRTTLSSLERGTPRPRTRLFCNC